MATWTVDMTAIKRSALQMPHRDQVIVPDCESTSFNFDEWKMATHTVAIRDSDPPSGPDDEFVSTPVRRSGCDWWFCPPFLWSSYNAPAERATRASLGIITKTLLRIVAIVMLAWQIAMTIYMGVGGHYDLSMYTFWNYTFMTVFCVFFVAALFYERILLTFTLLGLFPPLFSSVAMVRFGIVVIVGRNADVFLGDGGQSIEMRYVGDFVVHSLPLGMLLVVLIAGLLLYIRRAVGYELGLFSTFRRKLLYALYFLFSGLFLLAIYTASFSIAKTYPTGIHTGLLWLALVGVDIVWMGFFLAIFVAVNKGVIRLTVVLNERTANASAKKVDAITTKPTNTGIVTAGVIAHASMSVPS